MNKICIIGLGNMGKSIFDILKKAGFEVSGCDHEDNVTTCLKSCDAFVIAIKPQDFSKLGEELKIDLSEKLAISIMAGVSIGKIKKILGMKKVARVMPNLPLKVGKAFSGWTCSKEVSAVDKIFVKKILGCLGEEVYITAEDKINMITALSGSGPAYFFKLTELIQKNAEKFGFAKKDAEKIARQTFIGAAKLLEESGETAGALKEKVTSKGGTTEAALKMMNQAGLDKTVGDGIKAAYKRAKELNN